MSVADTVRRWLSADDAVIYEYRICGTTVDSEADTCPVCGSPEIGIYALE